MMADVIPPPALDAAVAETKALLRLEAAGEDAMIGRLVASAAALCEAFTGRWLLRREGTELLPASGGWERISAEPVVAIGAVEAVEGDAPTPLPVEAFAVDVDLDGVGWVRVTGAAARVRVTFTAGLAEEWEALPAPLRQGVVRLAAHGYSQQDRGDAEPPAAVTALWRPWRRLSLAGRMRRLG